MRDKDVIPIGTANDNPILDSQIYEVEYPDGHQASLVANAIAENLFAQVDDEGHRSVLLKEIVDHRVNWREVMKSMPLSFHTMVDDAERKQRRVGERTRLLEPGSSLSDLLKIPKL